MWLALRFPHWALDSRLDAASRASVLTVENRGGRQIVAGAGEITVQAGVHPGMAVADARVVAPQGALMTRRESAEQAALERLAGRAWRYSDTLHIACADTDAGIECARLVMEIGASLRLFGGRQALLAAMRAEIDGLAYRCRAGIGPNPAAALALARARRRHRGGLAALPLACLDLAPEIEHSLHASGLRQAGELLALPPATLRKRYGRALLDTLERLQGRRPHDLALYRLPERYATRHELAGAVEHVAGLAFVLRRVFSELDAFLRGAQAAIQTLRLTLIHEGRAPTRVTLHLSAPAHDAAHFERVAEDRLSRLVLDAPVLELALDSDRLRGLEQAQQGLWRSRDHDDGWPAVLDRLRARLGPDAVGWLHAPDDHRPQAASAWRDHPPTATAIERPPRPLWLLERPERLRARLELVSGAERIETGWWDDAGIRRDYYRARDGRGRLLWVYRDLDAEARGARPGYYLHGLFG